ncbi:MAG: MarR family transcriptional regulator [Deltaproteobacteria bacterium]|nr:MarR family transcriptional regulator [Deltaproteobacteria bacterium]
MTIPHPSQCPFYLISRVTLQVTSAIKKGLADAGVTSVRPAYIGALLCLWTEDGSKTVELARCARLEPSTMTGLLDRMERDGLIFREPDPHDRRAYRIFLTDAGREVEAPVQEVTQKVLDCVFAGIAEEDLAGTMKVLQQVLGNVEEESQ